MTTVSALLLRPHLCQHVICLAASVLLAGCAEENVVLGTATGGSSLGSCAANINFRAVTHRHAARVQVSHEDGGAMKPASETDGTDNVDNPLDVESPESSRAVFARLTETPQNWHQTVVYGLTTDAPEDALLKSRVKFQFGMGVMMVLSQCIIVPALFHGQIAPPCSSNEQCTNKGMFCSKGGGWAPEGRGSCVYCGTYAPLMFQWRQEPDGSITTFNFPEDRTQPAERQLHSYMYNATHVLEVCRDPKKSATVHPPNGHGPRAPRLGYSCYTMRDTEDDPGPDGADPADWTIRPALCRTAERIGDPDPDYEEYVLNWCDKCVDHHGLVGSSGTVDPLNGYSLPRENISQITPPGWTAYVFCAVVVTLTMVGEVKDILLVQFAVTNAHTAGKLSNQWRLMITIVSKVRRWVFVPALMLTVVGMVVYSPGTPMNIAFNTLALLFIVDIDNMAFQIGMKESVRARIEYAGRVELTEAQAEQLWWVKRVMMYCMPAALLAPCAFFYHLQNGPAWGSLFAIYFAMGVVEEFGPGNPPTAGNVPKMLLRSAKVIAQGIAGVVGFFLCFMFNM